jgi:serine protease Do
LSVKTTVNSTVYFIRRRQPGIQATSRFHSPVRESHSEIEFRISNFGFRICAACGLLLLCAAPSPSADTDIRRDATVLAVEQVMPSVVNIATETVIEYHEPYDDMLREFFGWRARPARQQRFLDLGSGVILDEEGYILTNQHVVRRANRIQVKLWDGREYEAERVAETERSDVALIRIKARPGEKFKAVKFAPDDDLLLGETVLALGNPYGLGGSVSKGILSSKNRRPPAGNEPLKVEDWLQTDAAINPGNSGGPLVNLRGELIGLNVAMVQQAQGLGFAIPIKRVSEALADFFSPETSESLWLGVRLKAGGSSLVVSLVQPASPADKAGLRAGDQVLQVNGKAANGLIPFHRLVSSSPNHEVSLQVKRGNEQKTLKVRMLSFPDLIRQKLGFTLLELTAQTAGRFGVKAGEALFIEEVEKNGPADEAQLQRGYLLVAIDGQTTGEIRAAASILFAKKRGDRVGLSVIVPRRIGGNFIEFRQGTAEVQVR